MKFIKPMIPYLLVTVLGFYLPPALIRDTGSGMVILLVIMPAVCLTIALAGNLIGSLISGGKS